MTECCPSCPCQCCEQCPNVPRSLKTLIAEHLATARTRFSTAMQRANGCAHGDDILTYAAQAKAAFAVVQALENLQFEANGEADG